MMTGGVEVRGKWVEQSTSRSGLSNTDSSGSARELVIRDTRYKPDGLGFETL
jgi:hypothetical protein